MKDGARKFRDLGLNRSVDIHARQRASNYTAWKPEELGRRDEIVSKCKEGGGGAGGKRGGKWEERGGCRGREKGGGGKREKKEREIYVPAEHAKPPRTKSSCSFVQRA